MFEKIRALFSQDDQERPRQYSQEERQEAANHQEAHRIQRAHEERGDWMSFSCSKKIAQAINPLVPIDGISPNEQRVRDIIKETIQPGWKR